MPQEQMSHKDRLRVERRANESFIRTYTRHAKRLPPLPEEDQTTMDFFNGIQSELQRLRMLAVYGTDDE